jgi:hypothetical protein
MMEKTIFLQYVELDKEIKASQEKQKELKLKCLAEMQANKVDTVKGDFGSFSTVETKSWTYSPKVAKKEKEIEKENKEVKKLYEKLILPLEEELKSLKVAEQNNGDAECDTTTGIRFTPAK